MIWTLLCCGSIALYLILYCSRYCFLVYKSYKSYKSYRLTFLFFWTHLQRRHACPLLFGVHYVVPGKIVWWADGALKSNTRFTDSLQELNLSMFLDGHHVFELDTIWHFLLALNKKYDPKFMTKYLEEQVAQFNSTGGQLVYSHTMQRTIVLRLDVIGNACDRPQRLADAGSSSGHQGSRYGCMENILFDVKNVECIAALLDNQFDIAYLLEHKSDLFQEMSIPVALTQCKAVFLSSVTGDQPVPLSTMKNKLQMYGPNMRTILDLFNAASQCKTCSPSQSICFSIQAATHIIVVVPLHISLCSLSALSLCSLSALSLLSLCSLSAITFGQT